MVDAASPARPEGRVLSCTGLTKSFGGVTVVKGVDLTVPAGSVVGLIGENGAGKSTTSSMIAGILQPDSGVMSVDGEAYAPRDPSEALAAGVVLIHQEIRMVPTLTVAENMFLGRLPLKSGRVDVKTMVAEAEAALRRLGITLDPRRRVAGLSMAVQQGIEIAKALSRSPRYIIFDEPSASLTPAETDRVLERIDVLRAAGVGVVYISHRLEEIRAVSQEIVCLRDGSRVQSWDSGDVAHDALVTGMVGRDFTFEHLAPGGHNGEVALRVENLGRKGVFEGIDFSVCRGEVLGIAGLVGAGRTEVVRAIAGADRSDTGTISLDGRVVQCRTPSAAIKAGIVMVPEDRKGQGLNLGRTGAENIASPWESRLGRRGLVTRRTIRHLAARSKADLDIRGNLDQPVVGLSGGNQQKVLLAKWLVEKPRVLILDEPTRGVDVGAKMAIYEIIRRYATEGVAVILVSSELEEVLGLAHRVLVMSGGRQRAVLDHDEATPEAVMALAFSSNDPSAADAGTTSVLASEQKAAS